MGLSTTHAFVEAFLILTVSFGASLKDGKAQDHTPGLPSAISPAESFHDAADQEHALGKRRPMHMRRAQSGRKAAQTSADGAIVAENVDGSEIDRTIHMRRVQSGRRAAQTSADGTIFSEDVGATETGRAMHMRRVNPTRKATETSGHGGLSAEDAGVAEIGGNDARTMQPSSENTFSRHAILNADGSIGWSESSSEADASSTDHSDVGSPDYSEDDIWMPDVPEVRKNSLIDQQGSAKSLDSSMTSKQGWDWSTRDYDCDGDGSRDCGHWDYAKLKCIGSPKCGHEFKSGDHLMEHSCRCMKCFDDPKTAAADIPMNPDMKKYFYGRWRGWNKLLDTCAPWLMPKNDGDLQAILKYAKQHKYTVRPTGASHSAPGLVTGWENKNVLVVSLAEYQAPGEWEYSFDEKAKGQATVKVNAGWSPLQLYAKIRPLDYFLPTQTAGPPFALGGLVSNCVHGGNYQKGFLHQYVKKMRVMFHNGTIREISDEAELRFWRNSYGLLGIATSIEFSLDYRPKFQAYFVKKKVTWTENNFWNFLKQDAHADLSDEVIPSGDAGDRKALMGQFFFNPYEAKDGKATMTAIVWRANENATEPGVSSSRGTATGYNMQMKSRIIDEILTDYPQDGKLKVHIYSDYNVAVKHWGGPKVFPLGWSTNDLLAKNAQLMTSAALTGPKLLIGSNRIGMNDGFFAYKVPNVVYCAYFMDPKHVWKAMNVLVAEFAARKDDPLFEWNGPPELRFITIADDAVLNPAPPGVWAVSEFMSFPIGKSDQGWKSAFKSVEDKWVGELGARPHIGKFFAFAKDSNGLVEPYQPQETCKIYTDAQKATFNEYRQSADPEKLFYGGDAVKLLQSC